MNKKEHLLYGTIFFIALWLLFEKVTITMILFAIPFSYFPDIDHAFGSHRNFFFHSIILWIVIFYFNPLMITLLAQLGVGFHCLCDAKPKGFRPKSMTGFYQVKFNDKSLFGENPFKPGWKSFIWFVSNFLLSLVIFLTFTMYFTITTTTEIIKL